MIGLAQNTPPSDHNPTGAATPAERTATAPGGELQAEVQQRLAPAFLCSVEPFRRYERGQEQEHPDASRPRERGEQHQQADRAQAARLDESAMRRAHRIAAGAAGVDALTPAPLARVVQVDDHRAARREGPHQMCEQDAGCAPGGPRCRAQHALIMGEAPCTRVHGAPHHAGHRAPARGQNGADQQRLSVQPGALAEERREDGGQRGEAGGQVPRGGVSWRDRRQPRPPARLVDPHHGDHSVGQSRPETWIPAASGRRCKPEGEIASPRLVLRSAHSQCAAGFGPQASH